MSHSCSLGSSYVLAADKHKRESRSARPESSLAVDQLPGDVEVTGMSRRLLDHVQDNPAYVGRFLHLGATTR